jgi:hypothetical protein
MFGGRTAPFDGSFFIGVSFLNCASPWTYHGLGLSSFKRPQRETDACYHRVPDIEHGDAEQSHAAEKAGDQTHHGPPRVDLQSNQICRDVVPLSPLNGGMRAASDAPEAARIGGDHGHDVSAEPREQCSAGVREPPESERRLPLPKTACRRGIKSAVRGTPCGGCVEVPARYSNVDRRGYPKADLLFRDEAANDHKAPARPPAMQTPEAYRCCGLRLSVSKRSGRVRAIAKPLRHP